MADAKEFARRFNDEVFNNRNLDVAAELISDDFVDHDPFPGFPNDKKGALEGFRLMFESFPDSKTTINHLVAEGDRVAIHSTNTGTHKGEFMGIPATGKSTQVDSFDIVRFDADGKAVEHWGVFDALALMIQLGVVPPPG